MRGGLLPSDAVRPIDRFDEDQIFGVDEVSKPEGDGVASDFPVMRKERTEFTFSPLEEATGTDEGSLVVTFGLFELGEAANETKFGKEIEEELFVEADGIEGEPVGTFLVEVVDLMPETNLIGDRPSADREDGVGQGICIKQISEDLLQRARSDQAAADFDERSLRHERGSVDDFCDLVFDDAFGSGGLQTRDQ